eukprot:scaffold51238_cov18-Tisochrysis_lutea.AAC.1
MQALLIILNFTRPAWQVIKFEVGGPHACDTPLIAVIALDKSRRCLSMQRALMWRASCTLSRQLTHVKVSSTFLAFHEVLLELHLHEEVHALHPSKASFKVAMPRHEAIRTRLRNGIKNHGVIAFWRNG